MSLFVIGLLSLFTLASVLNQFKQFDRLQRVLRRLDGWHLLPYYSFFAPRPMTNDSRIIYRLSSASEEWIELPVHRHPGPRRMIWNPDKYLNKALVDTCKFLMTEYHLLADKRFIRISLYYLTILMTISRHLGDRRGPRATVRFAIVTSGGGSDPSIKDVVFVSNDQLL
jgi:hypothetical protein